MPLSSQNALAVQVRSELPCPSTGQPGHARQPL